MPIDQANLANLAGLWKKYGSERIASSAGLSLYANTHWPHRCWLEWEATGNEIIGQTSQRSGAIKALLENLPDSSIMTLCPLMSASYTIEQQLKERKWSAEFEQTAMYLKLGNIAKYQTFGKGGVELKPVNRAADIDDWVDIGSEAFGYRIDCKVIERIVNDQDIQLLLGYQGGQTVATALLYKTGEVVGLHQMGVKRDFQGRGIAKRLMHEIVEACSRWQGKYIVLQASEAGKPLYDSLGFNIQFVIKNFQRHRAKSI